MTTRYRSPSAGVRWRLSWVFVLCGFTATLCSLFSVAEVELIGLGWGLLLLAIMMRMSADLTQQISDLETTLVELRGKQIGISG